MHAMENKILNFPSNNGVFPTTWYIQVINLTFKFDYVVIKYRKKFSFADGSKNWGIFVRISKTES
jgi:hypothetical protein